MPALVGYVIRSVHWQPMMVAVTAGSSVVVATRAVSGTWMPSALLFCLTAMAAAAGAAMDDPASETLAGMPPPRWLRAARAAAVVVAPASAAWTVLVLVARELPATGELSLMAAALCGLGLAVGAAASRRLGPTSGGLVAAPTVAFVTMGALAAPDAWALMPGAPAMAWRWSVIGAVAAAMFAWAVRDPARSRR